MRKVVFCLVSVLSLVLAQNVWATGCNVRRQVVNHHNHNVQQIIVPSKIVAFTHPNFIVAQPAKVEFVTIREIQPVFVVDQVNVHHGQNIRVRESKVHGVGVQKQRVQKVQKVQKQRVQRQRNNNRSLKIEINSNRRGLGSGLLVQRLEQMRANRQALRDSLFGGRNVNRSFKLERSVQR